MHINNCLQMENLTAAWEEVAQRKGAAGIDDISIKRWQRNWEERLVNLARDVLANSYKPARVRRFRLPKADGGQREFTILTVTDRVLQRAVLRVLDGCFDKQFLDCSFGYRQGRGVRDAVPVILSYRDQDLKWVLDADIDECFASLDHELLLSFVGEEVQDAIILRLMRQWVRMGHPRNGAPRGIILGAVISPLLCNIYLHRLDAGLRSRGYDLVRYADDFCVFCATREEAERAQAETATILAGLRLRFEPHKTRIAHFDEGFGFLGVHFYRRQYSFSAAGKRVEVEGPFDETLFYDFVPDGYG